MKRWLKYLPLVLLGAYSIFVGVRYFTNDRQVGAYTFNPFTNKLDYSQTATASISDTVATTTYGVPVITVSSSLYGVWGKVGLFSSSTLVADGAATLRNTLSVSGLSSLTGFQSSASSSVLSLQIADALNASNTLNVANTSTFSGAIMASGTNGITPGSGAGTRLMWIPAKGAFRVGTVDGTQWDNSNIGLYSIAMGYDSQATAQDGSAIGPYASASGVRGTAIGYNAQAIGQDSTAVGESAAAWGLNSVAIGRAATNFGRFSSAIGYLPVAEGEGSTALGSSPYIIGTYSTMIGLNSSYIPASKTSYLDNTFIVAGGNSTFGTTTIASHVLTVSATSTAGGVMLIKGLNSQTGDYFDVQNSNSQSLVKIDSTGALSVSSTINQPFTYDGTNTATINKPCGVSSITAAGQTATITNSLATGDYWVEFWAQSNPGAALSFYASTSTGSFTINTNAVTVNKTIVAWCIKKGY